MRLSGWRTRAPGRGGIDQKVIDPVGAILSALGADPDAHSWVTFGDESGSRWTLMAPCPAGLAAVNVRPGGAGEGSRASGRLIRWSKVQVGELAAETERGHRVVMFQLEGQPIRGVDDSAEEVAAFAALVLAGVEGRPLPDLDAVARRGSKPGVKAVTTAVIKAGGKPAAKPAAGPVARPSTGRSPAR